MGQSKVRSKAQGREPHMMIAPKDLPRIQKFVATKPLIKTPNHLLYVFYFKFKSNAKVSYFAMIKKL